MRPVLALILSVAPSLAAQADAPGAKPTGSDAKDQTPSSFARFVKVGDGGHLDTAVTKYRNQDGVEVSLFAAVHIADPGHYDELQRRFAACDALLYELVGPEDYRPRPGDERAGNPISFLQTAMKSGLELEFQLDAVDYAAANFVHADMSAQEFQAAMASRGESLLTLLWRSMVSGMKTAGEGDGEAGKFDLVTAFRSGEGRHQLRMWLGQQLEGVEKLAAGFGDGDKGSTLVEGRNEKCLLVLQQQIAAGRKQLGIYYGAAHLPHMEQRLVKDLGFHKVDHEWLCAWDCSKRPDPKFDRANLVKCQQARAQATKIAAAAKAWSGAHERHLPTLAQLAVGPDGAAGDAIAAQDPWGRDFVLRAGSRSGQIVVVSAGPDGVLDNRDDIVVRSAQ
jgi:hypothetical protein